jgi:hypothetical protein
MKKRQGLARLTPGPRVEFCLLSETTYVRAMMVTMMAMMVMLGVIDVEMDWRKAAF